jgi:drug/metabolite transporter (DMT)-like permease
MKNQFHFIITIFLGVILLTSTGYSQSFLRIDDDIGGSGGGSTNQTNDSDNTALYVIGGLALAGIIAYVIISKSSKKDEEEKSDTSSALQQFSGADLASGFDDFEHQYKKAKDKIPVNLILGVRNEKVFISDKTYLMGVSVRF